MARIVREAESSVGVFYSRFRNKQALLEFLAERYLAELQGEVAGFAAAREERRTRWIVGEVRAAVGLLVGFHRARVGWGRALVREAWTRPGGAVAIQLASMSTMPPGLVRGISAALDGHALERVEEGYSVVLSVTRERVLFAGGDRSSDNALGEDPLIESLTRLWLALMRDRPQMVSNL